VGRSLALLAAAAAAAVLAGVALAASPVTGSLFGQVTSTGGSTLVVASQQAPKGHAKVVLGKSTVVTKTVAASAGNITAGSCVMVVGQKDTSGKVTAQRVTLQRVPKGSTCGARPQGGATPGGAPSGRTPSAGGQRPPGGFVSGTVTSVKNGTLVVHGRSGSTTVIVTKSTVVTRTVSIASSAIHVKDCVFVRGTSTDAGSTVSAQNITDNAPVNGKCSQGFPRGGP
jgi:hypothetical protein